MIRNLLFGLVVALAVFGCGKKGAQSSGEATLDELNRALSVMAMSSARPPADINDLTNFPTLRGKTLPKAPAGKKLVLDAMGQRVIFADP